MANTNSSQPDPPDDTSWHQVNEILELDKDEAETEARIRLEQFNEAKEKILKSLQELEKKIEKELKNISALQKKKTDQP